jgi:hypothetical protein
MQRMDYRMATTNCRRTVKRLDSGETADDFSHAHNQRTPDSEYAVNRAINSNMGKSVLMVQVASGQLVYNVPASMLVDETKSK